MTKTRLVPPLQEISLVFIAKCMSNISVHTLEGFPTHLLEMLLPYIDECDLHTLETQGFWKHFGINTESTWKAYWSNKSTLHQFKNFFHCKGDVLPSFYQRCINYKGAVRLRKVLYTAANDVFQCRCNLITLIRHMTMLSLRAVHLCALGDAEHSQILQSLCCNLKHLRLSYIHDLNADDVFRVLGNLLHNGCVRKLDFVDCLLGARGWRKLLALCSGVNEDSTCGITHVRMHSFVDSDALKDVLKTWRSLEQIVLATKNGDFFTSALESPATRICMENMKMCVLKVTDFRTTAAVRKVVQFLKVCNMTLALDCNDAYQAKSFVVVEHLEFEDFEVLTTDPDFTSFTNFFTVVGATSLRSLVCTKLDGCIEIGVFLRANTYKGLRKLVWEPTKGTRDELTFDTDLLLTKLEYFDQLEVFHLSRHPFTASFVQSQRFIETVGNHPSLRNLSLQGCLTNMTAFVEVLGQILSLWAKRKIPVENLDISNNEASYEDLINLKEVLMSSCCECDVKLIQRLNIERTIRLNVQIADNFQQLKADMSQLVEKLEADSYEKGRSSIQYEHMALM